MDRLRTALTIGPFALVAALAAALTIAAFLSAPRPVASVPSDGPATRLPSPSVAESPTIAPTASPASTSSPVTRPNDASEMLRVHNELRAAIGAPSVRVDDRVTAAAQRHAEYLARNRIIGHEETPGQPGFTGATVRDRLAAQGYTDATASEVATAFSSGVEGVRSLWVLPYHRLGMMHPHAVIAGWGHADIDGRAATVGVLVFDFASSAPDRVRSPAADQRVPGSWHGEETPDALPAGAAKPVGYPIMVVYAMAKPVELRAARLTDGSGRELAHHVAPQIYERDYVAIVPASPLAAGQRYIIRLELVVAGADVVEQWQFEAE